MNVLFVSPEVSPIVRTGGLGDVVGSLPPALLKSGIDVRVLCPLHRECQNLSLQPLEKVISIKWGDQLIEGKFFLHTVGSLHIYLLDIPSLYDRPGIYADENGNYPDNALRSIALCQSAIQLEKVTNWTPDVFHAHDWMAAAVPAFVNASKKESTLKAKSILTIHNLEHQGVFSYEDFQKCGLPSDYWGMDGFEHHGQFNLLKGGIQHADKITTVSPTYAEEIRSLEYGCGLEESLKFRGADLCGILNGIDEVSWDSQKDSSLPHPINPARPARGKKLCKTQLLEEMGLPQLHESPLFGVVSRLYSQKGLDLLTEVMPDLMKSSNSTFVILGSGSEEEEQNFQHLAWQNPQRIAAYIGFDDGLARRIFAGSDFFIMPSRFEPCGLAQQYAMHYGSIPIARKTGGLADTISAVGPKNSQANGFLFDDASPTALKHAILQAEALYNKPRSFQKIRRNALDKACSWENAAKDYIQVYQWALN